MEILKQTAAVTGTPIQQISTDKLITSDAYLLGINNPDSYNQKELFYFAQGQFRYTFQDTKGITKGDTIAIINDAKCKYCYDVIVYDKSNDGSVPGMPILYRIGGRDALNINAHEINNNLEPWKVSFMTDGTNGYQKATIRTITFFRHSIKGVWSNWEMKSQLPYGFVVINNNYTFNENNLNVTNVLGFMHRRYAYETGFYKSQYPNAYATIEKLQRATVYKSHWSLNGTLAKFTSNDHNVGAIYVGYPVHD